MPCMYNGQPVKGNKGSCPYGSTWAEPQSTNEYAEGGNFFKDRYVTGKGNIDYGQAALDSTGLLGIAGIGRMLLGKSLMKGGKYLGDKMFRTNISKKKMAEQIKNNQFKAKNLDTNKYGLPNASSRTIPGRPAAQSSMINPATGKPFDLAAIPARTVSTPNPNALAPFGGAQAGKKGMQQLMDGMGNTRRLSPLKIGGTAAVGTALYDQMGGGLTAASRENTANQMQAMQSQQQGQASSAMDANTQALMDANAAKAESDRVAGLNPLEAMMENMKKPGYWTDPMNEGGPASDNRLNRMGQLMNYYGSTPKQRAAMGDPQKSFIATEQQLADNQAAFLKAQQTLSSKYGKPTVSNLATGMYDMVEEAYGDTWMPFDEKGEDELKRISTMAANIFIELSQDPRFAGASEDALRQEAVIRAGEELQL